MCLDANIRSRNQEAVVGLLPSIFIHLCLFSLYCISSAVGNHCVLPWTSPSCYVESSQVFLKCNSIRPAKKIIKKIEWKEKPCSIKSHQDFMGKEVKKHIFLVSSGTETWTFFLPQGESSDFSGFLLFNLEKLRSDSHGNEVWKSAL